jgi:hypothetical protein
MITKKGDIIDFVCRKCNISVPFDIGYCHECGSKIVARIVGTATQIPEKTSIKDVLKEKAGAVSHDRR